MKSVTDVLLRFSDIPRQESSNSFIFFFFKYKTQNFYLEMPCNTVFEVKTPKRLCGCGEGEMLYERR
jgi:hypothetical protein